MGHEETRALEVQRSAVASFVIRFKNMCSTPGADWRSIAAFGAEILCMLGDASCIAHLCDMLVSKKSDEDVAGMSPAAVAIGVLVAFLATLGTSKSHLELNKRFQEINPATLETHTEAEELARTHYFFLALNSVARGIDFFAPIFSSMLRAQEDFNLKLSKIVTFSINISLLGVGTIFGTADTRACKHAMSHQEPQCNEASKT